MNIKMISRSLSNFTAARRFIQKLDNDRDVIFMLFANVKISSGSQGKVDFRFEFPINSYAKILSFRSIGTMKLFYGHLKIAIFIKETLVFSCSHINNNLGELSSPRFKLSGKH